MRACFFGDIHGNFHALEAFLLRLSEWKADAVYCLGDIVGWLPFGNRTLQRVRALGFPTVAGNHDLLVSGLFRDHPDQADRMQATAYNAGLLSGMEGAADYLSNLPLILEERDFSVVHHSPFALPAPGEAPTIQCFDYLDETALRDSLEAWRSFPKRLIFSGHDHVPAVYELSDSPDAPRIGEVRAFRPAGMEPLTVKIAPGRRYWVKGGSIGGPYRDGCPCANAVLYDEDAQTLTLLRIPFPRGELHRQLSANRLFGTIPTIRRYLELLEKGSC